VVQLVTAFSASFGRRRSLCMVEADHKLGLFQHSFVEVVSLLRTNSMARNHKNFALASLLIFYDDGGWLHEHDSDSESTGQEASSEAVAVRLHKNCRDRLVETLRFGRNMVL
jgi:hypothetical protein